MQRVTASYQGQTACVSIGSASDNAHSICSASQPRTKARQRASALDRRQTTPTQYAARHSLVPRPDSVRQHWIGVRQRPLNMQRVTASYQGQTACVSIGSASDNAHSICSASQPRTKARQRASALDQVQTVLLQ
ncbi:hypothetical protein CRM22_000779 [Opisthorchis felineus]|uniref:Uncharacterized protein n=1 Tax=Opisthorchis felineus TaxID=147828 RepID=A0A4S2MDT2_OPIFE|nr:hypothetical protein CRM22_000779 [Opisthorchis felineus]